MKAAWFEKFGPAADVLQTGERPTPAAGAGEVLVRLATSGVNPSDVKKRAGSFPALLDGGYVIPNSDGAGIIEAVGDGVRKSRVGERVWVYQAQFARRFGTAAEYVAVASRRAPPLPEEASFAEGACLGIPVMTAHRAVFADGDVAGQSILVTGGAGRVGHYAIQWASGAGATVFATASNAADKAACEQAGATAVFNHRDDAWADDALAEIDGARIDRVVEVEFGANLPASLRLLKTNGVIATYGSVQVPEPRLPFFDMMYKGVTVRLIIVYDMPEQAKAHAIADIDQALRGNALQHRISHRVPLTEVARGNELIEKGGFSGAVVLLTGG